MDQLIEGMLAIGARLTPDNWTRVVGDLLARFGYELAVALHITLLEIGSKSVQILVIWQ